MQSENAIVGKTIGVRRLEELLGVLGVVHIVLAVADAVGSAAGRAEAESAFGADRAEAESAFGAGRAEAESAFGPGIRQVVAVVAFGSEGL